MTFKKHRVAVVAAVVAIACLTAANARTKTTRTGLTNESQLVERIATATGVNNDSNNAIEQGSITLRGFNKKASDSKESFFVTNNRNHAISHPRLTLRYLTTDGQLMHERQVELPVRLEPGQTRLVEVKTFDVQRMFYYYSGPKPRKRATPFKVQFSLVGYDIPVGK